MYLKTIYICFYLLYTSSFLIEWKYNFPLDVLLRSYVFIPNKHFTSGIFWLYLKISMQILGKVEFRLLRLHPRHSLLDLAHLTS